MDLLIPCFSSSTTMGNESKPRFISPSIAYRREAEAAGLLVPAECHHGVCCSRDNPDALCRCTWVWWRVGCCRCTDLWQLKRWLVSGHHGVSEGRVPTVTLLDGDCKSQDCDSGFVYNYAGKQAVSMKQPTEQNLPMDHEKMRIFSLVLLVMRPS